MATGNGRDVPVGNKARLWNSSRLVPPFDPHRHDCAETIRRAINLAAIVKLITGTIMTIAHDRVKLSPLPDCWKLSEIFTTGVVLGGYQAMMTSISFWVAYDTHFLSRTFEVTSHHSTVTHTAISAIDLQVSSVSQTQILVTRSRSWFFVLCQGVLHVGVFLTAGLQEVSERRKESPGGGQWDFLILKPLFDLPKHGIVESIRRALNLSACVNMNNEHKYEIVKRLQARKHICGMTGDGVIGIAVGGASSDSTQSASDILPLTKSGQSVYEISFTIWIVLGFMLLALIWKFDYLPFMVLTIATHNDGTIMTPLLDTWKDINNI